MKTRNLSGIEMQQETKSWLCDVNFFEVEIRFLRKLIEKLLVIMTENKKINIVITIDKELIFLEMQLNGLRQEILEHNRRLQNIHCDRYIPAERQAMIMEHAKLEAAIQTFINNFRRCKFEFFTTGEQILEWV